jgi:hypothetical protein
MAILPLHGDITDPTLQSIGRWFDMHHGIGKQCKKAANIRATTQILLSGVSAAGSHVRCGVGNII